MSATLIKNCEFAECGSPVRAIAIVPRTLLRPLPDSLAIVSPFSLEFETGRVAAALRHEAGNDAVKDRAVIESAVDQFEDMCDGDRCLFAVQFELDRAE